MYSLLLRNKIGNNDYATYVYNYKGELVKKEITKTNSDTITEWKVIDFYVHNGIILGEDVNNLLDESIDKYRYFYDKEGITAMQYNDSIYNFVKDALGNVIKVIHEGEVVGEYFYDAWGNVTEKEFEDISDDEKHVLENNPFRYRGYYYDVETQLYWVSSRYYSPELCRFISPDSVEYLDPKSVNGLNLYCYCMNNPIMYADPSGHMPEWLSDVSRFIGGLLIAGASIGLMATTITAGGWSCLLPGYGTLLQAELSLLMYGGFMMASSWDPLIQSDMEAINWNPFNSNPDMSHINKVSFYKGEAVILQDFARSSFSYGIMFLHKNHKTRQNTVKHEWGHFAQLALHGPAVFTLFMALPSLIYNIYCDITGDWTKYYKMPWEAYADYLGGVKR